MNMGMQPTLRANDDDKAQETKTIKDDKAGESLGGACDVFVWWCYFTSHLGQ